MDSLSWLEVPDWWLDSFALIYGPLGRGLDGVQLSLKEAVVGTAIEAPVGALTNSLLPGSASVHAAKLPLMKPFHVFALSFLYLFAVAFLRLIDRWTPVVKDHVAFRALQLVHNLFLVVLSLYMSVETTRQAYLRGYSIVLNGVDESPQGWPMAKILWIAYLSKAYEFVDTFLMCLRKNWNQVSFLHLYHHFTVFPIWWVVITMAPGGDSYFSAALNSFVHVIMYSYYFCATLKIPFPLKYYITKFQMLQFGMIFLHSVVGVVVGVPGYPTRLLVCLFIYMITLLLLFYNFLRQATAAKRKGKGLKRE